jgi:TfoX/Sxy family transcriptional regulator of competence genes
MAYDENLAYRIRDILSDRSDVVEKKMFGGLTFMVSGNMCVGVSKDRLMVRVGPEQFADAVAQPHARPMDMQGKPMKGFIFVDDGGFASDGDLKTWVQRGLNFVQTLPAK